MDSQTTISERADDVQLSIHSVNNTAKARNCDDYEVESINAIAVAEDYWRTLKIGRLYKTESVSQTASWCKLIQCFFITRSGE